MILSSKTMLAQFYDPDAHWTDTPEALRTPKQNGEMLMDIIHYGWPLFLLALSFAIYIYVSDANKHSTAEKTALRILALLFLVGGIAGIYFVYLR